MAETCQSRHTVTGLIVEGSNMIEIANGEAQSQDASAAPVTPSYQAPSPVTSEEKLLKQSEVNDLVGAAKHEAVERYKRAQAQPQGMQQTSTNGMTAEEVQKIVGERIQQSRNDWIEEQRQQTERQDANRIVNEFASRLDAGKGKYQDFDNVLGDVDLKNFGATVHLATFVDNTADVMYELAKNPIKMVNLEELSRKSPKLAIKEMQRLSDSIKTNQQASNFRSPNEPLNHLKPSNAGTDSGELTVSDFRKKYKG